jgi:hypothetical protein
MDYLDIVTEIGDILRTENLDENMTVKDFIEFLCQKIEEEGL